MVVLQQETESNRECLHDSICKYLLIVVEDWQHRKCIETMMQRLAVMRIEAQEVVKNGSWIPRDTVQRLIDQHSARHFPDNGRVDSCTS